MLLNNPLTSYNNKAMEKDMRKRILTAAATIAILSSAGAQAEFANVGFEDGYTDWTLTGDPYVLTMQNGQRTRDDYNTYYGWEGADVWFNGSPYEGNSYAVIGSNGNESNGSLLSSAWTATNQFVSFAHAGNNTSSSNDKAFAQIRDLSGNVLAQVSVWGYNDSVWRTWQLDLSAAGLTYGDQFQFYYQDGASWSVVDGVEQNGALLQAASNVPAGVAALSLLPFLFFRRRNA